MQAVLLIRSLLDTLESESDKTVMKYWRLIVKFIHNMFQILQ